jgi:hypothetical protein
LKAGWVAKVLGTNAVLLILLYLVEQAQAARVAYAANEGLAFDIGRSVLVQTSTLWGQGGPLVSPLTLDWIQVLLFVLVLLDLYFCYGAVRKPR